MRRDRSPVEKYHDRVASFYDAIYKKNPYWQMVGEISWRHIKRFLPPDPDARCLDIGCGTGQWGLRLLKSGYRVDFLDVSQKMLDEVARRLQTIGRPWAFANHTASDNAETPLPGGAARRCLLIHRSLDDLADIPHASYDFIIGQGDPLSCCQAPERAFKYLARLLKAGGVMALSVDNRLAHADYYLEKGDLPALRRFLSDGRTHWLTGNADERYPLFTFTTEGIRSLCRQQELELLSMIGKTVLPWRRFAALLGEPAQRRLALRIEESLHAEATMLGRAAHLEFIARKPLAPGSAK